MKYDENTVWVLIFSLALALIALTILFYQVQVDEDNNYKIPKGYAGMFMSLEEPVSIVVIDMNDATQANLAKEINAFYQNYNQQLKGGQ